MATEQPGSTTQSGDQEVIGEPFLGEESPRETVQDIDVSHNDSEMGMAVTSNNSDGGLNLRDDERCTVSPSQDEDEDNLYGERIEDDDVDGDSIPLTLLTLPPEIIWYILAFIDARFVIQQVSLVCKEFCKLVNDDVTWKVRISKRFPKKYPIIPDDEFSWKLACIQREEQHTMWANHQTTMESFCLSMGHIAAIDSVHLLKEGSLCISGSRDRHVQLWDLKKLDANKHKESIEASRVHSFMAHKGWIWDITSQDNTVVTSSWDCWVKLWDLERQFSEIRAIRGKSAFLSTVFLPDVLVSGSYDKLIYIHDHRADDPVVAKLHLHNKPVLSIAADSQYIISGSEDKTIAIYDRRAGKLMKQIHLDSFSMCMSYGFNQLWSGQRDGSLHVLDTKHGRFDIVETYDSGHKGKLTDVIHNLGAVITCSTDKTIKIHEPNHNPAVIATHSEYYGDVAALHLQNNVLASACSDATVGIWRPVAQ
ncbi:F-box/WD repeat-containing protein 9-like [Amphiura filiformis]|uniref:F-box/WD repeat-containing protein 9-like n=1 Tax=Amphiura filiformis TaxID=82378 RepID=UPI003B21F4DD